MKTNYKYTVILSAYLQEQANVNNLLASDRLAAVLDTRSFFDVPHTRAVGCYRGQVEQCFIIHTNSNNVVSELKRIAWEFKQQCILVSNNRNKAISLYYPDSAPRLIGERFAINNKLAGNGLLSYTVVSGEYWAVI